MGIVIVLALMDKRIIHLKISTGGSYSGKYGGSLEIEYFENKWEEDLR